MERNNNTSFFIVYKLDVILLFLVALFFCLIFSYTTSPIYSYSGNADSAIFQIVGKRWAEGGIPYVDIWDHKGPLIFFINAIGYFYADASWGVFLIQIIFLCVTLLLSYKTFKTHYSWQNAILLTFISLCCFSCTYEDGNRVEEYELPFIFFCFYLLQKWLSNIDKKQIVFFPTSYAFFYGLTVSICFLCRLSDAIGVCAAILMISIWLIYKNKWSNLFKCGTSFILGFLIPIIPFTIYFGLIGHLYEAWYGTILYNLDYAAVSNYSFDKHDLLRYFLTHINCLLFIAVSILIILYQKNQSFRGFCYLTIGIFTFVWLAKGNGYSHYGMITYPYLCLAMVELSNLYQQRKNIWVKLCVGLFIICIAYMTYSCFHHMIRYYFFKQKIENNTPNKYKTILKDMTEDDFNSFIAYDTPADIYLLYNIKPYYKYAFIHDMQAHVSDDFYNKIYDIYNKGNVKFILYEKRGNSWIEDILTKKYIMVKEDKDHHLYLYQYKNATQR